MVTPQLSRRGFATRVAMVVCGAAVLLQIGITTPWISHHDSNGAWISIAAANVVEYGVRAVGLTPVVNWPLASGDFVYYPHHPPLIVLLVAFAFETFGESESAARLVPIGSAMAAIVFFAAVARRTLDLHRGAALLGTALFALAPMTLYFGRMPGHEALTLCFALAALLAFLEWLERPQPLRLLAMAVAAGLAMFSGWPGYYLAVVLPTAAALRRRRAAIPVALSLGAAAVLMFWLHISSTSPMPEAISGDRLARAFLSRNIQAEYDLPLARILRGLIRLPVLFTLPVIVLAGLQFRRMLRRTRTDRNDATAIGVLLAVAVLHVVIFPGGVAQHDYWLFYFMPPLALAAAVPLAHMSAGTRTAVLLVFAINGGFGLGYMHSKRDPDAAQLGRVLEQATRPGDVVLLQTDDPAVMVVEYYARRRFVRAGETLSPRSSDAHSFILQRDVADPRCRDVGTYLLCRAPTSPTASDHPLQGSTRPPR